MNLPGLVARIDELKALKGFASDMAVCKAAAVAGSFLRDIRSGKSRNPSWVSLGKIAAALGTTLDDLQRSAGINTASPDQIGRLVRATGWPGEMVPIVGWVAAGQWQEAVNWADRDRLRHLFVPPHPRYPHAKRFALELGGTSMNQLYPLPGTYALCVLFEDIGRPPVHGDVVIVQRQRHEFVEATCKVYVERDDGSIWLEPRSTDPEHKPILVRNGEPDDAPNDDRVEVTALVTGAYVEQ